LTIKRTDTVKDFSNWDRPRAIATITLDDQGTVAVDCSVDWLRGHLDHGVLGIKGEPASRVFADDGERFLDGLLVEFSGTRVRASEGRPARARREVDDRD
jgi:hypothetical protein